MVEEKAQLKQEVIDFLDNVLKNATGISRREFAYKHLMEGAKTDEDKKEIKEQFANYLKKVEDYERFNREHRCVIEYIASLSSGHNLETDVLPEKEHYLLDHLLGELSRVNIFIMGGLQMTEDLEIIVKTASHRHAEKIGLDPQEYYKKIISKKEDVVPVC